MTAIRFFREFLEGGGGGGGKSTAKVALIMLSSFSPKFLLE